MPRTWTTLASGAVEVDGKVPVLEGAELEAYRKNVERWRANATKHGESLGVPPYWVLGKIHAESGGNPKALSPDGGYGLLQLTHPSVFQGHAPSETLTNPDLNIALGTAEAARLRVRLRKLGLPDDLPRVASCYNAGMASTGPHPSTSSPWGMRETKGHIDRVIIGANTAILVQTPGYLLARAARDSLLGGPMSWDLRRDYHVALLDKTFGKGRQLLSDIAHTTPASTCAICVGMWAMLAGVQERRGWPPARAITTWAGFGGFSSRYWIPVDRLVPQIGDVPYWCGGTATTWTAAKNGHVEVLLEGEGWFWKTAGGGGGSDGTLCRMSDKPKDIRTNSGRLLRGVWRPAALAVPLSPAEPVFRPCKRGNKDPKGSTTGPVRTWQRRLLGAGYKLPEWGADGSWGKETSDATEAVQRDHDLAVQRDALDLETWNACRK